MIKNIILDIDGTLWDSTAVVANAWSKAASESGFTKITNITADMLKRIWSSNGCHRRPYIY